MECPIATYTYYGCYLSDLSYFIVKDVPSRKTPTCGDTVKIKRRVGADIEFAIVLGVGADKYEARRAANAYVRCIGEIHGLDDPTELEIECTQDMF